MIEIKKDTTIKYMFHTVHDITPEFLREIGVEAVAFDLDNTSVKDSTLTTIPGAISWIKLLKEAGFKVAIVTNTPHIRAYWFSKAFGAPFHAYSKKPLPHGIMKMAKKLKVDISKIAMVGDQVLTDVVAANRCGAIPILVDPIEKERLFKKHFERSRAKEKPIRDAFIKEHGYYGENK